MIKEQFKGHRLSNSLIWLVKYFPEITGMDYLTANEKTKSEASPSLLLYCYAAMRFAGDPELMGKDPKYYANDIIGEIDASDLADPNGEFMSMMLRLIDEMNMSKKK